ncbi:MAG: LytR C-terminal domain-containing protein [Flaviflexus sp.]|nr:LytR C-terminal domain-containing protein [Flaviflexus sp.]
MNQRAQYRRRLQQRQTVIFGTLALIMAVAMLLASAWWTGVLPFPFGQEFTKKEVVAKDVVPCIVEGTPSVPNSDISVRVYNATNRSGLANSVAGKLKEQGVVIVEEGNWKGTKPQSPTVIYTPSSAIPEAYTLARMFPEVKVFHDPTSSKNQVLDIVLGDNFEGLKSGDDLATLADGQELTSFEGCQEIDR